MHFHTSEKLKNRIFRFFSRFMRHGSSRTATDLSKACKIHITARTFQFGTELRRTGAIYYSNFTVSIFQIHIKCTISITLVPYRIEGSKIRDFLATRRWSRCTGSQKRHVLGHFHSADRPGRLHLRYVLTVAPPEIPRFSINARHNTNRFRKFEFHRVRQGRFG